MGASRPGRRSGAICSLLLAVVAVSAARGAAVCTGDCDSSGTVSVNELITAVRASLDGPTAVRCDAADADGDGAVSVDELVTAVAASFTDCGALPLPTATPTRTATRTPSATPTPSFTINPSPTPTPTVTPPARVDGLWQEDDTRLVASSCDPRVESVRAQLFPLQACDFPVAQEGARVTFRKECRPARNYEASVDENGVVTGSTTIRAAQQGCSIRLEVSFSYEMGRSPTTGTYTLLWSFPASCRPLTDCEQTLRTSLTKDAGPANGGDAGRSLPRRPFSVLDPRFWLRG
jgi:hypothetical protein